MELFVRNACEAAARRAAPHIVHARFTAHDRGWDCLVLEAGTMMFKFPRHAAAEARLEREARTLQFAAHHAAVPVPALQLVRDCALAAAGGPALFSAHEAIAGPILTGDAYRAMDESAREKLAASIAATYVPFHAAGLADAQAAGVCAVPAWPSPEALAEMAAARLAPPAAALARSVLRRFAHDARDITVFGHFDTHGWNLALDESGVQVAGLFDFGHSGVGPLHRDLSYPAFVSADCAVRVARHYAASTGRRVDIARLLNTHAVLRLVELFDAAAEEIPSRSAAFCATMEAIATRGISDIAVNASGMAGHREDPRS